MRTFLIAAGIALICGTANAEVLQTSRIGSYNIINLAPWSGEGMRGWSANIYKVGDKKTTNFEITSTCFYEPNTPSYEIQVWDKKTDRVSSYDDEIRDAYRKNGTSKYVELAWLFHKLTCSKR